MPRFAGRAGAARSISASRASTASAVGRAISCSPSARGRSRLVAEGAFGRRHGGLVAQHHLGLLRHRSRDGDALLLAAGKLCRNVVEALAQADQREGVLRLHGIARNLGDERHVLARREARNQVVELEDERLRAPADTP